MGCPTRLYKKPEIDDFSRCRERRANSHVGLGDVGKTDCRAFHEEIAVRLAGWNQRLDDSSVARLIAGEDAFSMDLASPKR
jgi:hypothetical protein